MLESLTETGAATVRVVESVIVELSLTDALIADSARVTDSVVVELSLTVRLVSSVRAVDSEPVLESETLGVTLTDSVTDSLTVLLSLTEKVTVTPLPMAARGVAASGYNPSISWLYCSPYLTARFLHNKC